jgi:sugar transferase (PEP-CTERM/EpsH1 system associated)
MQILALSAQIPYPPHSGKAMRDYHLLAGLARKHTVHLLCMVRTAAETVDAAPLANRVPFQTVLQPAHGMPRRLLALLFSRQPDLVWRTASPSFRRLLAAHLAEGTADVLLVEGLEMAAYGQWAQNWLRRRGRPVPRLVLDEHNAEYLLQRRAWQIARRSGRSFPASLYSWVQARRLARFEALACRQADDVVAVSPADRAALLAITPTARVAVVPNGVDTDEYAPLPAPPGPRPPTLVFTGRMDFRPNVDAVQWFCAEIWPRIRAAVPDAHFQIVGRDATPDVQALGEVHGVRVVGAVPNDRPAIGHADLYVLPMRFGGGIRFKLLQALSMARAIVSTPLGADGVEGLVDGEHLCLAEQSEAFADRTVQLLHQPELRARLGQAGRALVVAHYDWSVLLPRLEAVLSREVR